MSKIISTGSTFRIYGDDLVTHNQLPHKFILSDVHR